MKAKKSKTKGPPKARLKDRLKDLPVRKAGQVKGAVVSKYIGETEKNLSVS